MAVTPYKVIFFDLFHTLVDVGTAPGASGRYTADILGVGREEWNAACFSHAHEITRPTRQREVIKALAESINPAISMAKINAAAEERQRRFDHALLSVEDEVLQVLRQLREAGLRLALISNASTDEVSAWPRSPLSRVLEAAIFSCECGYRKPQPEIYRHALQRMGVGVDEALFVGDGGSDEHQGAAALGLDNVLLTRYVRHLDVRRLAERREAVKWEIAHLRELPAIVL